MSENFVYSKDNTVLETRGPHGSKNVFFDTDPNSYMGKVMGKAVSDHLASPWSEVYSACCSQTVSSNQVVMFRF